jgi:hypothetical protein
MDIPIATAVSIREAGFDEYWLRDKIYDNPSCLCLGDLESVSKERIQSSGGRLDVLLKNSDDDSMYEVEIMLGETDESHIIRTIEYWDNEKRRWPQRQHFAVLVAESITRRFFNVIQLLSHSIPIIAIQVNMIESGGNKSIHFSKVLDTYDEPDDGASDGEVFDEAFWKKKAPWTIEAARALVDCIGDIFDDPTIRFLKNYVAFTVQGNNYFWFQGRSAKKSLLGFRVSDEHLEEVSQLLDKHNISFVEVRNRFKITSDADLLNKNRDMFRKIAEIAKFAWQK